MVSLPRLLSSLETEQVKVLYTQDYNYDVYCFYEVAVKSCHPVKHPETTLFEGCKQIVNAFDDGS